MRKKMVFFALFFCLVFVFYAQNKPGLSLEDTFDLYVKAIHSSDLKSLFSTVTGKDDFYFLTSSGKLIDSRKGYYKFHKEWFDDDNWNIKFDLLKAKEFENCGYTIAKYEYKGISPEGKQYISNSYFTLLFHKENNTWRVIADICTPENRYISKPDSEVKYRPEQEYLFKTMHNRRTVRKFKSDPVPEEHILKILRAAKMAPTAGNQQPWKFLVIRDKKKLDKLEDAALEWYLNKYKQRRGITRKQVISVKQKLGGVLKDVLSAPVYVAVLVDSKTKYPNYIRYDGTLAAGYLMIAARSLGYGTGFFTTFFPEDKMQSFFKIPDRYKLICFTPIGVPVKWPKTPPKKELKEVVVFDKFNE